MHTETRNGGGRHSAGSHDDAVQPTLSSVLDRITDGVLLVDGESVIVYVNEPLADMFGYQVCDLVGEAIEMLLPHNRREEHRTHVEQFAADPTARPMGREDLDIEGRHADGTNFPIDIQLDVLPGSSVVVATVRDMTKQRQASADNAIARIDLAHATAQIAQLEESLDLVIQGLFALGTSITAGESNEPVLLNRLANATKGIDEVIDAVQRRRRVAGH